MNKEVLELFCGLDDVDVSYAIKKWSNHKDFVLNKLCNGILNRQLLKVRIQADPFNQELINTKISSVLSRFQLTNEEVKYLVFTGEAVNTMYKISDERINILFKDKTVKNISDIDDSLIHQTISAPVKKFFICYLA